MGLLDNITANLQQKEQPRTAAPPAVHAPPVTRSVPLSEYRLSPLEWATDWQSPYPSERVMYTAAQWERLFQLHSPFRAKG